MNANQLARQIALDHILQHWYPQNGTPAILDKFTIEKPYAWIFFYTTQKFADTGDILYAVGGNAPIFVAKWDSSISSYPTYKPINEMIDDFEEDNKCWQLQLTNDPTNLLQWKTIKNEFGLSQAELTSWKAQNSRIIATGAYTRLQRHAAALQNESISIQIILNPAIIEKA